MTATTASTEPAATDPTSSETGPVLNPKSNTPRLGKGALRDQVHQFLADHPGQDCAPSAIATHLGRSSGAVGNALDRLVDLGQATRTGDHPRRYALNPTTSPAAQGATTEPSPDTGTSTGPSGKPRTARNRNKPAAKPVDAQPMTTDAIIEPAPSTEATSPTPTPEPAASAPDAAASGKTRVIRRRTKPTTKSAAQPTATDAASPEPSPEPAPEATPATNPTPPAETDTAPKGKARTAHPRTKPAANKTTKEAAAAQPATTDAATA